MKKTFLVVLALSLAFASSALAVSKAFTSGTVFSIGSVSASPFKPSPKVTLNAYFDVGVTVADKNTDWAGISYHQSAIGNKKGFAYWTSKSDPGMYYFKNDTAGVAAGDVAAPTTSAAPTATGWAPVGQ